MRANPNNFRVMFYEGKAGYFVEDEFGDCAANGFQTYEEAQEWIDNKIDNWEPPDAPGWEGGFADNH